MSINRKTNIPSHVAIIMDGNGRWAKQKSKIRLYGHLNGVQAVRETVEGAAEIGIKYLTLYAFSQENWERPKKEITGLMNLLMKTIKKEIPTLMKNNIKLKAIGNIRELPNTCQKNLQEAIEKTKKNNHMTLILALSYSSRWEIVEAVKKIIKINPNDSEINENLFSKYLNTNEIPDPELVIRTSGEYRISNFLLWQIAYSELYFSKKLWPDFNKKDLNKAINDFKKRKRRFGKIN